MHMRAMPYVRRLWWRVAIVVLCAIVLVVALDIGRIYGLEIADRFAEHGRAATLTDLHDVSQFQTAFNDAAGTPRLVLLLSPT